VSGFVGGDKLSWGAIPAGQRASVTLKPGPMDDRHLTLLYTMHGEKRRGEGPQVGRGVAYRMAMQLEASGTVSYRHCLQPCRLD